MLDPKKFAISTLATATILAASLPIKSFAMAEGWGDDPGQCREMAKMDRHNKHGHPGGPQAGLPGEMAPPYLRGLKLSDTQRDQIFELMHEKMPQLRNTAKQARQSVTQLHTQALSDAYDSAKARHLADSAGRAHGEMLALRAEIDQKVFAILNAEQRQQLAAKIADQP